MGKWLVLGGGDICTGELAQANITFDSQGTFALLVDHDEYNNEEILFMADRWNPENLSVSRYVWLPVTISSESIRFATMTWHNEWKFNNNNTIIKGKKQ